MPKFVRTDVAVDPEHFNVKPRRVSQPTRYTTLVRIIFLLLLGPRST
jgi:hypothetical protein